MTYRSWNYRDILAIAELEKECFAGESWDYQMFASSFAQEGFFGELCEEEGLEGKELVGYGCVQCVMETADLMNIAVAPPYRKQGVGRTL
ncbi:MAG: GNAT family N-acetyltransferase, partial [Clostridia bacterium]|nr:GNAT family N-acetyltransferase [Clostridia bacterium]